MFCEKCGAQIETESQFCGKCGNQPKAKVLNYSTGASNAAEKSVSSAAKDLGSALKAIDKKKLRTGLVIAVAVALLVLGIFGLTKLFDGGINGTWYTAGSDGEVAKLVISGSTWKIIDENGREAGKGTIKTNGKTSTGLKAWELESVSTLGTPVDLVRSKDGKKLTMGKWGFGIDFYKSKATAKKNPVNLF